MIVGSIGGHRSARWPNSRRPLLFYRLSEWRLAQHVGAAWARALLVFRESCHWVRRTWARPASPAVPTINITDSQANRESLATEYSRGYMAGWRECFEQCLEAVEDEIARTDDIWRMGAALTSSKNNQREN